MDVLFIVGICVILGVTGQLLMKKGMNEIGRVSIRELASLKLFSIVFERHVLSGIILYGLACLLWLVALSMEDLSYVYPLMGTAYIFTAILAWFFFGEKLTVLRILGIILISVGAYLVVIKP